jgi:glycosyltransferase involved in cell wall biosynthesis
MDGYSSLETKTQNNKHPMRILYLHQYYHTPAEGGGIRSYHIGHALAEKGHEVHIITTWEGPCTRVMREGRLLVTSLPIHYHNSMAKGERIKAFRAFVWQSYLTAKAWGPADKVFATSTPLTIGLVALLLKYLHNIPYVFEVRDCWPEAPIQLGYVKGPLYKKALRWLERWIYNGADSIITLSDAMAVHVNGIVPNKAISVVSNFADRAFFGSVERKKQGDFHIVYTGTFGYANDVHRLLALAFEAKKTGLHVHFTLAGDGAEQAEAKRFVAENGLSDTITFLPHLSTYGVRELLSSADAAYVGFRPEAVLQTNSPNKFFDALAAGLPILLGVEGWLADEVRQAGCGIVMADYPGDLGALRALLNATNEVLGANSLDLAANFDKKALVAQVVSTIDNTEPIAALQGEPVSLQ